MMEIPTVGFKCRTLCKHMKTNYLLGKQNCSKKTYANSDKARRTFNCFARDFNREEKKIFLLIKHFRCGDCDETYLTNIYIFLS